jgi:GH24 family phage-related lysozyme (muramidase)
MTNRISQAAVDIVKHFEGLRLEAYECSAGVWTIGYGTTYTALGPVKAGQRITESEAETLLASDLRLFERRVHDALLVPVTQHQFDALVSFAYNVGAAALAGSTLLRKLHKLDLGGAADEFLRWVRADGQVLPGLVRRRKAERAMFLGRDWRAAAGA